MSGPPSRPTPPSKPQSVSHEGVTISGIRVGSVLQGTRSQDRWPAPGRPRLGGHMSPGGSFALSASSSRSSGSTSAANRSRAGGRSDPAAQDKIQAAGSRSSSHRGRSGSKIQAWRSFSAGSCNEFSGAHVRSSRRAVSSGSEFKFSLRSSKSLSSSDKSLLSSVFEPDDVSIPRRQDSTLSVHLSAPKSPSGSVEYACAVSPPSSANVLPGSPLRRPVLETKVSARVVTTTVEFMPPAHAVTLASPRSGLVARASGEALESDTREDHRRRSVTFTGSPFISKVPETSVRDGATVASVIPESKPEQPQEKSQLPEPKTTQPQQIEPRLGPPVSEHRRQ
ncbi:hypothetical protein HPB50_011702 [Hyalomma asiaticum]|uniref:Uncharacterized protein n=1 Tax=Hyalomma asiaticum TaxID=266040 RepID=A0ACB7SZW0_HYAAI|nr:hypothetical protein HPB50_011702 [Hyalomma asiaticum]